jgi:hypothetical protein
MSAHRPELEEETAYLMVKWVSLWGRAFADKKGRVLLLDNMALQDAMELLIDTGVFKEIDQFESRLVTAEPRLKTPYDLEDVLYVFHQLGDWYGYGVKYREQGFKTANSIAKTFDKLVSLGYCDKIQEFYFWTNKTFSLNRQGWGIYTPTFDEYLRRQKKEFFETRKSLSAMEVIGSSKLGFKDWDNDKRLEKFVELRVKNKWRETPTIWPDAISLD